MEISGDSAAGALVKALQYLITAIPDGWSSRAGGVMAGVTGVPVAALNGVWSEQLDADEATVVSFLDRIADARQPHSLQVRPDVTWDADGLAASRRMIRQDDIPLMALIDPIELRAIRDIAGLSIRELTPAEAPLHAHIAALGFDAPEPLFAQLMTPQTLALTGVRTYVAEMDGQPVATGLGLSVAGTVGIFNVATPPEYRRRGYGAAITARAGLDGLENGADWGWLQSSPQGHQIYQRLGFSTVETWRCWVNVF
jgi:GNAT superfamily N-acetyltransferase